MRFRLTAPIFAPLTSDDRNPLKADMISLRGPVSRRVNRTGGSDDPKLIGKSR